jgi:carboxyl-terminal processing protease
MLLPRRTLLGSVCAVSLGTGALSAAGQPLTRSDEGDAFAAVFDEIWRTVRDRFYDPNMRGIDWSAMRTRYRPGALAASSLRARAAVINAMLGELGASHTRYYLPDEPAYYQLAGIFVGALRRRGLERFFPEGEVKYPGIGIWTRPDPDGRLFVSGIIQGTAAAASGLVVGDEIIAADNAAFRAVDSFRGKVGETVKLSVRRTAGGPVFTIDVVGEEIHPNRMFLRGLEASARVIPTPRGTSVGYARIWCYAGDVYQHALERLIGEGPLKDTDALILDLRDGWGGAEPQYLDLFNHHAPTMLLTSRSGEVEQVDVKWRKRVALLVNAGTRSGKEVLAYGFRKYGLGEVIGTRTEGAVLAATAFLLEDGSLLLLAVENVQVDGERLEGLGVSPMIEVPFDIAYAAGRDPQLDRAVRAVSG